jgi:type IV pilus assembly protein PilQ
MMLTRSTLFRLEEKKARFDGHSESRRPFFRLALMASLSLVMLGCAGAGAQRPEPPKQAQTDFFNEWKLKAEASQGHSPASSQRLPEPPVSTPPKPKPTVEPAVPKPQKSLPTQKVSLRMHDADIVVVLRALARSVSQNILINEKVKGSVSVDIDAVPWDQAFRGILRLHGLDYAWEGDLLRIMTVDDLENDLKMEAIRDKQKAQKAEVKWVEPLMIQVIPIDFADAAKLQEELAPYLSKDEKGNALGSIAVDGHTNSLMVHAIREDIARLLPLIQELDKPTPQITIVSHIVETTREVAQRLGVQWGGFYQDGDAAVTPGGTNGHWEKNANGKRVWVYDPISGVTGIGGQGFGSNFPVDVASGGGSLGLLFGKLGGNVLDVQLMALQSDGQLNILSSPSITTLDNQTAFTENGEKVPYESSSELSGTEVKFEDVVLRLEITPHVIQNDYLKMKILVKKDEVDFTRKVAENPLIIKKQTQTTLITKDGETIVISGLTRQKTTVDDKGVPGLADTPILGRFFKSNNDEESMEEVLIFITPHILKARNMSSVGSPPGPEKGPKP